MGNKRSTAVFLVDAGNTHIDWAVAVGRRFLVKGATPTRQWLQGRAGPDFRGILQERGVKAAAVCSVVPRVTKRLCRELEGALGFAPFVLTADVLRGLEVDYPKPETIGPDRLANALAAKRLYGAPVVVVDFGTAVTFDVVDGRGAYVGGVIAPGLEVMLDYLHQRTALLPRVDVRPVRRVIGRSTQEAMRIGAVRGYSHLVRGVAEDLKAALAPAEPRFLATGGFARLIVREAALPAKVCPNLALKGLLFAWEEAVRAPDGGKAGEEAT